MRSEVENTPDINSDSLAIPPHSVEAEQAVLGNALLNEANCDVLLDGLHESDFYRNDHRLIFSAIKNVSGAGQNCDIITVADHLQKLDQLNDIGGIKTLSTIAEYAPIASNIESYIHIVRQRAILRQLIKATAEINRLVFDPQGKNSHSILDFSEQRIFEISDQLHRDRKGYRSIHEYVVDAQETIHKLENLDSRIIGLSTGFHDLDTQTSGLQNSDLIIIAGRPGMGKTAFALNIAGHVAIEEQKTVVVFSMEMPGEQLAMRMIASLSNVDQQRVRTGNLQEGDWKCITSSVNLLKDTSLFIDDVSGLTPTELRARCRRIARDKKGLDLVIIDYMQLMQAPEKAESRTVEMSMISRDLKSMAKELHVPVIALSQLNRSLESRSDKRPVMSDLRDSGSIEQDADVVLCVYRDEVYDQDNIDNKGLAEILIRKQRNGPIGTVKLSWRGNITRFENYINEEHYSESEFSSHF